MNIKTTAALVLFTLLAICVTSLPALADTAEIIPESRPDTDNWKPQEPRQEFVVRVTLFTVIGTRSTEDMAYDFLPSDNYTYAIDSNPKQFAAQMHRLFPNYNFSVITSVDKVCSNQEPCVITYGPQPTDPTKTTLTAEFRLKVRDDGGVSVSHHVSQYCIDLNNSLTSPDGKTMIPNEQTQSLFSTRILKAGDVTVVGGFVSEQYGRTFFAISITPHIPEPKAN